MIKLTVSKIDSILFNLYEQYHDTTLDEFKQLVISCLPKEKTWIGTYVSSLKNKDHVLEIAFTSLFNKQ